VAELITVMTELRNNSIVFEWEPLWDDVYPDIEDKLRSFVAYVLSMGVVDAVRKPGYVELIQATDEVMIARGIPVPTRKSPNAIPYNSKWWTLMDSVTPKGACIPVNILRRLEVAATLKCSYHPDHVGWFGEMKLKME